ncbi:MAG: ABC transporter ATP-binding protein [Acidimicrobiia bacterium]|nr:ABC transporter ATP-binding protein [Acidimicrobiia bacterium]
MSLKLENITVKVPDGSETHTLLEDVSLEVKSGTILCLTGPSGSGKSTLLAVAGLLRTPDRGIVSIDGEQNISQQKQNIRARIRKEKIGFIFQSSNLFPALRAIEQLELIAHINKKLDKKTKAKAKELLDAVGLSSKFDSRPAELSGGERQRVAIARALMNDPKVLLCDEPTASLDEARGIEIMSILHNQAIEHKVATLVVTHAPSQFKLEVKKISLIEGALTAS